MLYAWVIKSSSSSKINVPDIENGMLAMLSIHMLGVLNMEGLQGNSLKFSCCELSNKLWSMLGVKVFKSILNVPCITQRLQLKQDYSLA